MNEFLKFFQEVKSSFKKAWADAWEWYLLPITSIRQAYRCKPANLNFIKTIKYLFLSVVAAYKDWISK